MWHWMMLKIQLCITEMNDILTYIHIENSCFQINASLVTIRDFEKHLKKNILLNSNVPKIKSNNFKQYLRNLSLLLVSTTEISAFMQSVLCVCVWFDLIH